MLELQTIDLGGLNEAQLKAFFLNAYNGLAIHGLAVLGSPSTPAERAAFFDELTYVIGGHRYSLYDIKHGILRCLLLVALVLADLRLTAHEPGATASRQGWPCGASPSRTRGWSGR